MSSLKKIRAGIITGPTTGTGTTIPFQITRTKASTIGPTRSIITEHLIIQPVIQAITHIIGIATECAAIAITTGTDDECRPRVLKGAERRQHSDIALNWLSSTDVRPLSI